MASATESVDFGTPSLSSNDSAVLQALFDAESTSSSAIKVDALLPKLPNTLDSSIQELQDREMNAIKPLNTADNNLSVEMINTAISNLSEIVKEFPAYAPAYLNRAQALRLLIESQASRADETSEPTDSYSQSPSNIQVLLFENIAKAISLLTPQSSSSPISPFQSRILANAHTHRGYILYKAARSKDEKEKRLYRSNFLSPQLQTLSDEQLEEVASYDFQMGGKYGNEIAKQMAVGTNPYAKMCGAIVKDAMKAEIAQWNINQG